MKIIDIYDNNIENGFKEELENGITGYGVMPTNLENDEVYCFGKSDTEIYVQIINYDYEVKIHFRVEDEEITRNVYDIDGCCGNCHTKISEVFNEIRYSDNSREYIIKELIHSICNILKDHCNENNSNLHGLT